MKKVIFLTGSFVFLLFLISCGSEESADKTNSSGDFFSNKQSDNEQEAVENKQSDLDEQTDNEQEAVENKQAIDEETPPSPNTFTVPELQITDNEHPTHSQEPETKYVCEKEGKSISYSVYKPGISNSSHACELDTSSTPSLADWRAFHQKDYCDNKLSEIITEKKAQGFVCSQEN